MSKTGTYHPLLERQLRDMPPELRERIAAFLDDVNASYTNYDDNYYLLERASQLSFDELNETNATLRTKAKEMEAIITSLKDSIAEVAGDLNVGSDDAEVLLHVLRQQIDLRKQAEQRIVLSEQKYRSIIEGLQIGIIETDLDGLITKVYPQFTKIIGFTEAELLGKHPTEVLVDPAHLNLVRDIETLRKEGRSSVWEARVLDKSGKTRTLLISGSPIRDVTGEVTGSIGLHFDITEHVERAEALELAQHKAEAALRSQETFLANISHEMRTPMNAIIGLSRILQRSNPDPQTQHYAEAIGSSARDLLTIINDVLDMARMNAGEFKLEFEAFDLCHLLKRSEVMFKQTADEKGVLLSYSVDSQLTGGFNGDPTRLNQIVTNLVGNAIKFTEAGGWVKVSASPDGDRGVRIEVRDNGVGIDADRIGTIFESFKQEDDSVTRKYGGTGLGLSITRQLVRLFGGTIEVQSTKGQGSTFTVLLPLERAALERRERQETLHDLSGLSVLLVEDNPLNRMVAEATIAPWGCTLESAENGIAAIEALGKNPFDVVLMDLQMPVMGGLEAVRKIRDELKLATPVVALTANALPREREACFSAGMDAYVSKPLDPTALNHTIVKTCAGGDASNESLDYSKLRELLQRSNEAQQNAFIEEMEVGIRQQAGALIEALSANDFVQATALAHGLRPLVELSGLALLMRQLKQFEQAMNDDRLAQARLLGPTIVQSLTNLLQRLPQAGGQGTGA